MTYNDENLCRSICKGNRYAFEVLIQRWEKPIFNLAYRYLLNREAAEDCTQEIFIKLFNKLQKFNYDSSFKTWLYRVATNTVIDYQRKQLRYREVSTDDFVMEGLRTDSEESVEDKMENINRINAVQSAIKKLPKIQKHVLILKEFSGMTFDEISESTGIPISTVKSRLYTALENLKKEISRQYQGGEI
ncbi:MAG: RNA polymerase sigma factor [Acidobacteria bacterium]|nr:RNA polymerase sigma factor [Acidobacteriota bacterium]